jgi:hypothetical protein
VAKLLTHTHETAVSLAERVAILEGALMGTRQHAGEFDAAFACIDTLPP